MPLLIVQGPNLPDDVALPTTCCDSAGQRLTRIRCDDADAVSVVLRTAPDAATRLVLIEPGALRRRLLAPQALRRSLDTLPVPYIELHADGEEELEPWLHPRHAPIAVVVTPHDRARGYAMSLAIAAHRLLPVAAGH